MLTSRFHQALPHMCQPQARQIYTTHMCGLCHALGDGYGLLTRLFTGHELIVLNLLTSAQLAEAPAPRTRRCPLNPARHVLTNVSPASEWAAAVAVLLAQVKFADDVADAGSLPAQLALRLNAGSQARALHTLQKHQVPTTPFTALSAAQTAVEKLSTSDAAAPSAEFSAFLFATAAQLAGQPANAAPLAEAGAAYGRYVYLADAYRDYAADAASGAFNPLRRFGPTSSPQPAPEALAWLTAQIQAIAEALPTALAQVNFQRYGDLLTALLVRPVQNFLRQLTTSPVNAAPRRWQDFIRAGLFGVPAAVLAPAPPLWVEVGGPGGGEVPGVTPGKRRANDSACCDGTDLSGCGNADCSNCNTGAGKGMDCMPGPGHCGPGGCSNIDCMPGPGHCGPGDCNGCDCNGVDCNCNN